MRPVKHLTPRYVYDRLRLMAFNARNPDVPWLTPQMVRLLETWLQSDDRALEWGSGRSTRWFASRIDHITSVEHDPEWYRRVTDRIESENLTKRADIVHVASSSDNSDSYVQVVDSLEDESLDFCLVDGLFRGECAVASLPKLRSGGAIVVDDVHRYLPSPLSTNTPYARSRKDGPLDARWKEFQTRVSGWRSLWTSSGVSDTALWLKP